MINLNYLNFIKKKAFWVSFEHYIQNFFTVLIFFLYVFFGVRFFVTTPGRVSGPSMTPTFADNQLFFVNKLIYLYRPPERFDVVQVIDPKSKKLIIKRVLGLPGETVVMKRGKFYLENVYGHNPIPESYLSDAVYTTIPGQNGVIKTWIGANEYFVVGDNRGHSIDSRHYGPIPRQHIIGLVQSGKPDQ